MYTVARTEVTQVLGEYHNNTHPHTRAPLLHAAFLDDCGSGTWQDESVTTAN